MNLRHSLLPVLTVIGIISACEKEPRAALQVPPVPAGPAHSGKTPVAAVVRGPDVWAGVYSTPSEIGGFSGTVLAIEVDAAGQLFCRKWFHTDVNPETNDFEGKQVYARLTAAGDTLVVDGDAYTRMTLQNRTVLMRPDALSAYQKRNELYDYGILIKVSDTVPADLKLSTAPHESIKCLYTDPSNPWADPYVRGANER
jgi:hypothetical protein